MTVRSTGNGLPGAAAAADAASGEADFDPGLLEFAYPYSRETACRPR